MRALTSLKHVPSTLLDRLPYKGLCCLEEDNLTIAIAIRSRPLFWAEKTEMKKSHVEFY